MAHFNFLLTIFHDNREVFRAINIVKQIKKIKKSAAIVSNLKNIPANTKKYLLKTPVFSLENEKNITNKKILQQEAKLIKNYQGLDSIYKFCETEFLQNNLMYKTRTEVIQKAVKIFSEYEKICSAHTFDYFIQVSAEDLHRAIFAKVGHKYAKKELLQFTESPFPDRPLFVFNNYPNSKILNAELLKKTVCENKVISKIKNLITYSKKDNLYLSPIKTRRLSLQYFLQNKERIAKTKMEKQIKNNFISRPLQQLKRHLIPYESLECQMSPFVFYPLHAPLESQTIVRGFSQRDEFSLIQSIALSLPLKYKLLVKEHPGFEGFYPIQKYYQLAEFKNVAFLNPSENSHNIIKKSKLVIVINSTVWLESILFKKPVIALGNGIFSGKKLLWECKNIDLLAQIIPKALTLKKEVIRRRKKFLYAYWKSCYPVSYRTTIDNTQTHKLIFSAMLNYAKKT